MLALVTVLAGCGNPPELPPATAPSSNTATPTRQAVLATPIPSPTPRISAASPVSTPASYASRAETINALLAPEAGVYGIVVATPQGKVLYSRNADLPFISASLYKLVLMADVYNLEAQGQLSFDEEVVLQKSYFDDTPGEPDSMYSTPDIGTSISIKQALFAAVAYSSNVAARALLERVGDQSVNEMASQLGLEHTFFQASCDELPNWPPEAGPGDSAAAVSLAQKEIEQWCATQDTTVNITTPNDITQFLSMVYQGEIVSQQASQGMLELLKEQAVDNKFPVLLPAGTTLAHKTGDLDGTVHHDVGIIYAPSGPVILTAMSTGAPDDDHDWQVIQRLAFIVYGNNYWPPFTAQAVPDESGGTPSAETPGAASTAVTDATAGDSTDVIDETPVEESTAPPDSGGETPDSGP